MHGRGVDRTVLEDRLDFFKTINYRNRIYKTIANFGKDFPGGEVGYIVFLAISSLISVMQGPDLYRKQRT